MSSLNKTKTIITCATFLLFAVTANAQKRLASEKPPTAFYSSIVRQRLDEQTKMKANNKTEQPEKHPASMQPLKQLASEKIKNRSIGPHNTIVASTQEKKKLLISNSAKLKEIGKPATNQRVPQY